MMILRHALQYGVRVHASDTASMSVYVCCRAYEAATIQDRRFHKIQYPYTGYSSFAHKSTKKHVAAREDAERQR